MMAECVDARRRGARSTCRCSAFVLGLGPDRARARRRTALGDLVADVLPDGAGLLALLGATVPRRRCSPTCSTTCPRCCVLLPAAAAAGPQTVLAVLIGVNAGPNLTYTGSLATLLWRRVAARPRRRSRPRRVPPARRADGAADPDRRYRRAVAGDVRVLAWITEGGWEACVDAVATLDAGERHAAARRRPSTCPGRAAAATSEVMARMSALAGEAAEALLDDAEERLGDDTPAQGRRERAWPRRSSCEAAADADVLVLARDGRHTGPHSIGHAAALRGRPRAVRRAARLAGGAPDDERAAQAEAEAAKAQAEAEAGAAMSLPPGTAAPPPRADDRLAHAPRPVLAPHARPLRRRLHHPRRAARAVGDARHPDTSSRSSPATRTCSTRARATRSSSRCSARAACCCSTARSTCAQRKALLPRSTASACRPTAT